MTPTIAAILLQLCCGRWICLQTSQSLFWTQRNLRPQFIKKNISNFWHRSYSNPDHHVSSTMLFQWAMRPMWRGGCFYNYIYIICTSNTNTNPQIKHANMNFCCTSVFPKFTEYLVQSFWRWKSKHTQKKNDSSQLDRFVMAHNILKKNKKDNITTPY